MQVRLRAAFLLCLFSVLLLTPGRSSNAEEPLRPRERPEYKGRVNDYGSRLSQDAELILEHISFQHQSKYGDRLVLLTIDSLKGNDAEDFSDRVLAQWELAGTEQRSSRVVLILVAVQEKRVRIHTSLGMDEDLHPNVSAEILSRAVLPELKKGLYSIAMYRAFDEITAHLQARHEVKKRREKENNSADPGVEKPEEKESPSN